MDVPMPSTSKWALSVPLLLLVKMTQRVACYDGIPIYAPVRQTCICQSKRTWNDNAINSNSPKPTEGV